MTREEPRHVSLLQLCFISSLKDCFHYCRAETDLGQNWRKGVGAPEMLHCEFLPFCDTVPFAHHHGQEYATKQTETEATHCPLSHQLPSPFMILVAACASESLEVQLEVADCRQALPTCF